MSHFGNYNPAAFGWTVDPSQIVPFSYKGVSFPGGVHRRCVGLFAALLDDLVPHLTGPLVSPGCWGYSYRPVRGSSTLSFHAYGLAIDVNAPRNPMTTSRSAMGQMPANAGEIGRAHGCEWGGEWNGRRDLMHFEVHLAPAEIPAAPAGTTGPATIRSGTRGQLVKNLQRRLNLAQTGHFDVHLDGAVRQYQRVHRLAADGVVGPATWTQLLHAPILAGERLLQLGSTGEDVAWLQRRLHLTPSTHPAFGPVTRATMIAWERQWKRTPDGVVQREDWRKLGILAATG